MTDHAAEPTTEGRAASEDAELASLLDEAEAQPVWGWDFSWLGRRMATSALPWDYDAVVLRQARAARDMLDMGTGGGEWLAALPVRPPRTVATEGWEPNVDVAGARLRPLSVTVVRVEGAPDNVEQEPEDQRGPLPFPARSFELVVNRHEAFVAKEVARVLEPGGRFVTQQVGSRSSDLHTLLDLPLPPRLAQEWDLALAVEQLERAGLRVVDSGEGEQAISFADVGALAWYLKAVPWEVPDFSLHRDRRRLAELHRRINAEGSIAVQQPAFWLEAVKPRAG